MLKRTLYFGNPAYLSTTNEQLVIALPQTSEKKTIPIEDLGIVILDNQQITISQALMARLLANNVALITCNETHHPVGLFLNLDGHTLQSQKFKAQVAAPVPLKKQLWQQTVSAKIANQAHVLARQQKDATYLYNLSRQVRSNDADNLEAQAAAWYWKRVFPPALEFTRQQEGFPPNNLLNYGYAILRAVVARSLVGSGLLPTLGIFHRNQYNAYCLADDIMEPYRPFVDEHICSMMAGLNPQEPLPADLTPALKRDLLAIPTLDVTIDNARSPMAAAIQRSTASLAKCFEVQDSKPLLYASYL